MRKTEKKILYPWQKGLNLNNVPGTTEQQSLVRAKNIVIKNKGSLKKFPGVERLPYTANITGLQAACQFYATLNGAQRSEIIYVAEGRVAAIRDGISYDLGVSVSPSDVVVFERFSNALIIHFENTRPKYYTIGSATLTDLPILESHIPTPPSFSQVHDRRLWYAGVGGKPHNAYVSAANDPFNFTILSGGFRMTIEEGDGDPVGLTGFSGTFRGDMYAMKFNAIYRIYRAQYGYGLEQLTEEVGSVCHNVIQVTPNDVFFVSPSAIHSLLATAKYGAAEEYTVTAPIYEWFQENVNWNAAKNMISVYDSQTNAYLLSFASAASGVNDRLLGFNLGTKEFFQRELIEYPVIGRYFDLGRKRVLVGSNEHGLGIMKDEINTEFDGPIDVEIKTGQIMPLGPNAQVNFTKIWIVAKPTLKSVKINLTYYIDGLKMKTAELDSVGGGEGAVIGADELIGAVDTLIGANSKDIVVMQMDIPGTGTAIQFQLTQEPPDDTPDQPCEIFGFIYEYDYEEDTDQTEQV